MDAVKTIDDKKFMWDGEDYESESTAMENISKYENDGFETQLVNEDGKYAVYTRRVVTDIVTEGDSG